MKNQAGSQRPQFEERFSNFNAGNVAAGFFPKLERFVQSFEKKNKDHDLAVFLNEILDNIEINQKYAEQLEMDLFERETIYRNKLNYIYENEKLIDRSKIWLKQIRYAKIKTS